MVVVSKKYKRRFNMAKNEAMEKHEEFKAEFKKRVKEQAKMLYRKSLDEISDRHKFV